MSTLQSLHLTSAQPESSALHTRRTAAIATLAVVLLGGLGILFFDRGGVSTSAPGEPASDSTAVGAESNGSTATAGASEEAVSAAVPAGTKLTLEIIEPENSVEPKVGNPVVATLVSPLEVDGSVVVPAGAKLVGRVTETLAGDEQTPDVIFGVAFDSIEVDGKAEPIVASLDGKRLELAAGRQIELELGQRLVVEPPAAG